MANESVAMRLELIAAKAKQLAQDEKANKLYPDDLKRGLQELAAQITQATREAQRG